MTTGLYSHTTRSTGTILTAAIYNGDHVNHITNLNPEMMGGYDDVTEMQDTVDPGGVGTENVPANIYDVLKQHEFVLHSLGGGAHWYDVPGVPVGPGNVVGPAGGVVDEEYALFDGTTGLIIQGGKVKASVAEVQAGTANKVLEADHLITAAAFEALVDAATVAIDWDTFENATLQLSANRALGNPTNGRPGQWRFIVVSGNDGTDRTLTFGNQYGGTLPALTDIDNVQKYLLAIFCKTATQFLVFAADATDA